MESQLIFYSCIFCFILSVVMTRGMIFLGKKYSIHSEQNYRRKKKSQVPLLGGVGIYLSVFVANWILSSDFLTNALWVSLPIVAVGVWDDIRELSAKPKFLAQVVAGLILSYLTSGANVFSYMGVPALVENFLLLFTVIICCNAVNFIDGVDSLAGVFTSLALLGFWAIGGLEFSELLILHAGIMGFLIFNRKPARIYLGDSGSNLLGVFLSIGVINSSLADTSGFSVVAILFVMSAPFIDMVLAVSRRMSKGLSPFKGDSDHIHHKLKKIGLKEGGIVLVHGFIACSAISFGVIVHKADTVAMATSITLLSASLLSFVLAGIYYMESRLGTQASGYGRSLIQKYFKESKELYFEKSHFRSYVIDLLPYYKELQVKGFIEVDQFVSKFARMIESVEGNKLQITFIGQYSVALIDPDHSSWSEDEKDEIKKAFYDLTAEFNVVKNYSFTPEGMHFYGAKNKDQFVWLLESEEKSIRRPVRLKKVS